MSLMIERLKATQGRQCFYETLIALLVLNEGKEKRRRKRENE